MSTTTRTRAVRFLGSCRLCKAAGRPHAHRVDATVTTERRETRTVTLSGADGFPRIGYRHTIEIPGEPSQVSTDGLRYASVTCRLCVAAGRTAYGTASVLLSAVHGRKTDTKCGARCRSSLGPSCECACGGENHGCGYPATYFAAAVVE